ncbi:hypothetical protein [Acidithiobacillus thiooxidans]|uniref:hypothetical protein n=1 Tax=Acidithiobacillus thiooxidans TaxID=930 RepID=UPI0018E9400B|nr:hypothetical protein [Acidithiobacillus thiooxidans]
MPLKPMNDQNVFYSTDEFPQAILASWAPILENRANCPRSARIIAHHRPESPPTIIQNDCPRWARIRTHVESIRLDAAWAAAAGAEFSEAEQIELMRERFQWPPADDGDDDDYSRKSPDDLVANLVEKALARHGQHVGKIHAAWSRAIGLSSRRLSRRTRYAPDDRLLKSIVVSTVDDRMQFDEFLAEAKRRYGLIIGDAEGSSLLDAKLVDQEELSENRDNLETRLVGLGLVRRLSDSCSFVENPFAFKGNVAC